MPATRLLARVDDAPPDVLWLAGEHSGDQHAARLALRLRELRPELRQVALGGPALEAAGVPLLHDLTENSVVGFVEVLKHYRYFKKLFGEIAEWIRAKSPRVLVLVDYPGFNLRLAAALHREGLTRKSGGRTAIYYYISPQIWAWKAKRRFAMARHLDELGVIFPFETGIFEDTELPVRFVGHPFLDSAVAPNVTASESGHLLLLPGSRIQPVRRIFPVMLDAVSLWRERSEENRKIPITTVAPNASVENELRRMLSGRGLPVVIQRARQPVSGRFVLTSSGTMSLACALAGLPGAIVYRAHPLTYRLGRRVIKVPFLGIANLILGRAMYPEFIQDKARPTVLADVLADALDESRRTQAAADARELRTALEAPAAETAAERILALLDRGPAS